MEMVTARAFSDDHRVRVLEAGATDGSPVQLTKRFRISTPIRWLQRELESSERTVGLRGEQSARIDRNMLSR